MPGNPREMITMAERRFPVRIRIAVPPGGLGQRYARMTAWLDENCGADGWAMTPQGRVECSTTPLRSISSTPRLRALSSLDGVSVSGSISLVARFQVREDEPALRAGAALHRTP